ncbi:hypothetical protein ISN45_Aa06g000550, partial [Arabidopsis thaliana x Arabidopsis arenosa]
IVPAMFRRAHLRSGFHHHTVKMSTRGRHLAALT